MKLPPSQHTFYDRLESFANHTGLSLNAFGQKIGFGPGAFSRILRDRMSFGVARLLHLFEVYPELNPRWLFFGESPMILDQKVQSEMEGLLVENLKLQGQNEALREVVEVWSSKLKAAKGLPSMDGEED